jgi:hypothetical protein
MGIYKTIYFDFYIIAIPEEKRESDCKHDPYVAAKRGFPM